MDRPDWTLIEEDFLATGMSYSALAKKWKVPLSTLKKKAAAGKWGERFKEIARKAEPEAEPEKEPEPDAELIARDEFAVEIRSQRYRRMIEATDGMMDRIIDAMQIIKPEDTFALGTLVRALKDLREMQGLNRTALDIEEQKLRIEKMRLDIQYHDVENEPVVVEFVNTEGAEA